MKKNTITLLIFGLVLGLVSLKIILTANVPEEKTNEVTSDSSSVKKYLGSKTECTIDEYVEFNSYLDEHYKDVAVYGYVTDIEDEFNMTVSNKETNGDYEIHVYSSYNIDMLEIGQKVFLTGDMYRCNGIDEKEYMYGIKLDSYTNQYLSTGDDSIDYIDVNTFYDKCVLLYEKTSFVISGELIRNTIYGQVCYYLVATNQEEETTAKLRVVFSDETDIEQYLNSEIQIEADYCKGVEGTWVTNAVIL